MSASLYANGQRQLKADADTVEQVVSERREALRDLARARRDAEDAKPSVPVPADAVQVRVRHLGWFPLVRVNKTTVTVIVGSNDYTGAEATCRYPLVDVVAVAR